MNEPIPINGLHKPINILRLEKTDKKTILTLIDEECSRRNLNPHLIAAIIEEESSFDTYAMRYEPDQMRVLAVEECAKINGISEDTERNAQRISFGLGQVLGSTLRWLGYRDILSSMCDPKTGVYWCCEAFERLGARYEDTDEKIAAYNEGSAKRKANGSFVNQNYVDQVKKHFEEFNHG